LEIECKIKVASHDPIRAAVERGGGHLIARMLEVNHMFDRPDGALRAARCGLRVREIRFVDDPHDADATITWKGPPRGGAFKSREEIEFGVADATSATALLAALGFERVLMFEKRRERWRFGDCLVELDELPFLGRFVEVEGPGEASVSGALADLKLADAERIARSYARMLDDYCRTQGRADRTVRFAE
jgi:adenylate cyclase class 2